MTCEDACDFDTHVECFDKPKELELCCRGGGPILKRKPGFSKVTKVRDANRNHEETRPEFQFCNSCDTFLDFNNNEFYTCDSKCDLFICLACAECPNGHSFKLA
eukprot:CAMPEP_0170458768 /NCGR_PEP_ID=MMETSP0123-20130129/5644_1 /TAXON_ID=182087 /ORGANISM="Favella ehrenbergii, Strain Fehren 1" /LENGTH=103 /DNA_ID=CAMNT_0010723059 /DNA_START=1041 /DNA_END=1352 /DNA_ORIENTATION=+